MILQLIKFASNSFGQKPASAAHRRLCTLIGEILVSRFLSSPSLMAQMQRHIFLHPCNTGLFSQLQLNMKSPGLISRLGSQSDIRTGSKCSVEFPGFGPRVLHSGQGCPQFCCQASCWDSVSIREGIMLAVLQRIDQAEMSDPEKFYLSKKRLTPLIRALIYNLTPCFFI